MIARGAAAVLEWYLPRRRRALERVAREACAVQEATLLALVRRARETEFGLAHDFGHVRSMADYQARVPVSDYTTFALCGCACCWGRRTSRGPVGRATG